MLKKSYDILRDLYLEKISFGQGKRILDVGCGPRGNFINIPSEAYIGIDTSKKTINKLRERQDGKYLLMDAKQLNFKDGHFSYIISTSFFHHLSPQECLIVCGQMKRKLKKDGLAIIVDGVYPHSRVDMIGRTIRFFDRGRFVRNRDAFKNIFLKDFKVTSEYYFVEKFFAYCILVLGHKGIKNERA